MNPEIRIVRHAHAPSIEGVPPDYRSVSERGLNQCLRLRRLFDQDRFFPNLILHSPLQRAAVTAIAGSSPTPNCIIVSLSALFPTEGADADIINEAFPRYQYDTGKYVADTAVNGALNRWGKSTTAITQRHIDKNKATKVLIVTHAIYCNWLADWLQFAQSSKHDSSLFDIQMGECDQLIVTGGDVRYSPFPRP